MYKICEVCKKVPATIHLTDIHNNVKKEMHMCEICAEKKGLTVKQTASIQDILSTLQEKKGAALPEEDIDTLDEMACEDCGMTWSDFRNQGRFGCTKDYDVFEELIRPLLDDIQTRGNQHIGKSPAGDDKISQLRNEILTCRRNLQNAIEEERYEEAAVLRDQLSHLEQQID